MIVIIQSLFVYITFGLSLYFLGRVASQRQSYHCQMGSRLTFWTWEIVASLVLFAFISGIRWNVGVDYQSYLREYLHAQTYGTTIKNFEFGFEFLTQGMALLGFHYAFYFALLAFLQLFFVYRTFKDERYLLPYIGITVVLGFHYLSWMNGIRQMLAATIFLFAIQFIVKRKLVSYFFTIIFASLIHKSSVMLIPFYFLPLKDFLANRTLVVISSLFFLYVGMDPNWISLVEKHMPLIIGWVGYEEYSENIGLFVEQSKSVNFGPRTLTTFSLFALVVFYSPNLKRKFSGTNFLIYYNIYVVGFLLYSLFVNSHHIFLRPITYLTVCSIPVTAYLLVYLSKRPKKYMMSFALALVLASAYTPLSVVADFGLGDQDYSNYRFFWFHDGK